MSLLFWMQMMGIFGEVVIAGLGIGIGLRSKSNAGWFIGASFVFYALYDFIQMGQMLGTWATYVAPGIISLIYLAAVVLMLFGAWTVYKALE